MLDAKWKVYEVGLQRRIFFNKTFAGSKRDALLNCPDQAAIDRTPQNVAIAIFPLTAVTIHCSAVSQVGGLLQYAWLATPSVHLKIVIFL